MADELIDICDEHNTLLNIQNMKSEAHRIGLWHRASHIWMYNSQGEILLQLRAKEKALYPDLWDISVAGHVSAGEDPITSGLREAKEEIGLTLLEEDLDFWMIKKVSTKYKDLINNEFYYVYFCKFDGDVGPLRLQEEEVQNIQFFGIDELEKRLQLKPETFVPHGTYWFEVLNLVKSKLLQGRQV